jgi:guanylate kinase
MVFLMLPLETSLVILSGPSCVGKSPLRRAFFKHHPELAEQYVLVTSYTSRAPRPGEQEGDQYHFRSRREIQDLQEKPGVLLQDVRGDLHAIDSESILTKMHHGKAMLYEGNPFLAKKLMQYAREKGINHHSLFLSPLSQTEIKRYLEKHSLDELREALFEYMKQKLIYRAMRFSDELNPSDLENIERRAKSTFSELKMAPEFNAVIPNHDGEAHQHWDLFNYPIGDAGKALQAFVEFISDGQSKLLEQWDSSLL